MTEHRDKREQGHPMSHEELSARAARRAERVREGQHRARFGHARLAEPVAERLPITTPLYSREKDAAVFEELSTLTLEEVWTSFWARAASKGLSDPPCAARDHLIHHYGTVGFLEERYRQQLEREGK